MKEEKLLVNKCAGFGRLTCGMRVYTRTRNYTISGEGAGKSHHIMLWLGELDRAEGAGWAMIHFKSRHTEQNLTSLINTCQAR